MKKIFLLTLCLSLFSATVAMEKDEPKKEIQDELPERLCELPTELKAEIIARTIPGSIKNRKSFNLLKKEVIELKCSSSLINLLINKIFTEQFIIDLATFINVTTNRPISYYQLAKILLTKDAFSNFAKKHQHKANILGLQLLNKINSVSQVISLRKFKALIKKGANTEIRTEVNGTFPIAKAVYCANLTLLQIIIDAGANLNTQSGKWTALHACLFSQELTDINNRINLPIPGNLDIITEMYQKLLNAGIYVNIRDNKGNTPLFYIGRRHPENAKMLLAAGAEVNIKNKLGQTALFHILYHGQMEVVKMLIDAGAGVNYQDNNGNTPLMESVNNLCPIETIKLLLDSGANPDIKNNSEQTIEDFIFRYHFLDDYGDEVLKLFDSNANCTII